MEELRQLRLEEAVSGVDVDFVMGSEEQHTIGRAITLPNKTLYASSSPCWKIMQQRQGVGSFMTHTVSLASRSFLNEAICAFPWREADKMRASVDHIVKRSLIAYLKAEKDPILEGCVDEILPPPTNFLTQNQLLFLEGIVAGKVGKEIYSLLFFYETVYKMVERDKEPHITACILFDSVFTNVWDDFSLRVGDI